MDEPSLEAIIKIRDALIKMQEKYEYHIMDGNDIDILRELFDRTIYHTYGIKID